MRKVASSKLRKIAKVSRQIGDRDVEQLALFALGEINTTSGLSKQASGELSASIKVGMFSAVASWAQKKAFAGKLPDRETLDSIKAFAVREKLLGRVYHSAHAKGKQRFEQPTTWLEKKVKDALTRMSSASDLLRALSSLVSANSIDEISESIGVSAITLKKHLDPNLDTKSKVRKYAPAVIEHAIDAFAQIKDAKIYGFKLALILLKGLILAGLYSAFTPTLFSTAMIGTSVVFGKFLAGILVGVAFTSSKSVASFLRKSGVALGLLPLALLNDLLSFIGWSKEKLGEMFKDISGRLAEVKKEVAVDRLDYDQQMGSLAY